MLPLLGLACRQFLRHLRYNSIVLLGERHADVHVDVHVEVRHCYDEAAEQVSLALEKMVEAMNAEEKIS